MCVGSSRQGGDAEGWEGWWWCWGWPSWDPRCVLGRASGSVCIWKFCQNLPCSSVERAREQVACSLGRVVPIVIVIVIKGRRPPSAVDRPGTDPCGLTEARLRCSNGHGIAAASRVQESMKQMRRCAAAVYRRIAVSVYAHRVARARPHKGQSERISKTQTSSTSKRSWTHALTGSPCATSRSCEPDTVTTTTGCTECCEARMCTAGRKIGRVRSEVRGCE